MSEQVVTRETPARRATVLPRTDVFETDEALVLVADLPGVSTEGIELALDEDVLTLKARASDALEEGWSPAAGGLELPDYERRFRIASDVDREHMTASLQNGRLRVVLEKRRPKPHRIDVKNG